MRKKIISLALLAFIAVLLIQLFLPKDYPGLPATARESTQYWHLSTGSNIAYTLVPAEGPKNPHPIIYLHGGPGGPISDDHIAKLSALSKDGYDLYFYDQIGGGFSARLDNIGEYTAERHRQDLEAIIETIGAQQVILIGQSWGAILATLYVADHPERIRQLIFTSPGPMQPFNPATKETPIPDSLPLRKPNFSNAQGNKMASSLRSKFMAFLARNFQIKLASDLEADQFATYLNSFQSRSLVCDESYTPAASAGAGYYVQLMTLKSLSDLQDNRAKLQVAPYPILLLKGQCDNQPWGVSQEYLDIFPNHQFEFIEGAGHSIAVEAPAKYLSSIRAFLLKHNH